MSNWSVSGEVLDMQFMRQSETFTDSTGAKFIFDDVTPSGTDASR